MTMLSFRIDDEDVADAQRFADRLGIDRSQLLRDALRRHLIRLRTETDIAARTTSPPTTDETSFGAVADWGPAEDWLDWVDVTR
ncbi:MAG: ribbon-helix-helix protein, CopG family [Actinobacteria bacterium]|nr:ribbon-helix-helix protein, CopG family [Actinomycetota bacterium]